MDISVQMLGTGSAFSKKYSNCNGLVTVGDFTLLIDCGTTAVQALYELDIPLEQINGIFISHLHADHVGGLEEVAFLTKYVYKYKPLLFLPQSLRSPLWEHTLRGGLENELEGITTLDDYFEVIEIAEGAKHNIHANFQLEIIPTHHVTGKPSYGLVINDHLFYSGDTRFDAELIKRMHDEGSIHTILHDCQLNPPSPIHASLEELLTLPEGIQKKVFLMHYEDNKEQFVGKIGAMTFLEQYYVYTFR